MTTYPDMLMHLGGVPVQDMTQGNVWFVKPSSGSDGYRGKTPRYPVKTLTKAKALAIANQNDIIYMFAESDTAASTTDYQSTTLLWTKDAVHLKGVNAAPSLSQRSRIAILSTATAASVAPLMTVSANGCKFENIEIISALGAAGAVGNLLVSGQHNHFVNCHIAGTGHATQDVAGNYSLKVTGQENLFEDCTIGLDTIARGAGGQTYEMYMSGGATRNIFRNCRIITYAGANTQTFLTVPTTGIDRWNLFENCSFINMPTGISSGTTMTQALSITGGGSPDGCIILRNCSFTGATKVETSASGKVQITPTITALTINNNI